MTAPDETGNPLALIDQIITQLRQVMARTDAAMACATSVQHALSKPSEEGVKHPVQPPLNTPKTRAQSQAAHRRAHRPGQPSKIESDPELEAFILARIDTLTYAQIVSEVRTTFPPDRHCSMSGLSRWWQKQKTG